MRNDYLYNEIRAKNILDVINDKYREFGNRKERVWDRDHLCTYYFVIDANEIGRYCFPIDFSSNLKLDTLSSIFDSQISYYDLFFLNRTSPILFDDYKSEIQSLINYFTNVTDDVYNDNFYFENFYNNVKNVYYKNESLLSKDRDVKLSFTLSMISFGADRLNKVYKRLIAESDSKLLDKDLYKNYTRKDIENKTVSKCYFLLGGANNKNLTKSSLRRDIRVISKIISLNKYYEDQYNNDELDERIIFLYLSSANQRTEVILDVLRSNNHFCVIDGEYFDPWRKPLQIFLYLINRVLIDNSNNSLYIDLENTMLNLSGMRRSLLEIESYEDKSKSIPEALLDSMFELYDKRKNNYLNDLKKFENMSLDNRLLPYYDKSIEEIAYKSRKKFKDSKEIEIAKDIMRVPNSSRYNVNDLINLRKLIEVKQLLGQLIPDSIGSNEEDLIINIYDSFPFNLKINIPQYRNLLDDLISFWIDYHSQKSKEIKNNINYKLLFNIINQFLEIEASTENFNEEHAVIRIMLHLVSPSIKNVDEAFNKLKELFELNSNKYLKNEELLYIYLWVLRKKGSYSEALKLYENNLKKYNDSRMDYGYVLVIIASLIEKSASKEPKVASLATKAVNKLNKIIKQKIIPSRLSDYASAAMLSNLVYLNAFIGLVEKSSKHLAIAEIHLDELKKCSPKKLWLNKHNEFYFIEAFYEYTTALLFVNYKIQITPKSTWDKRINSAIKDMKIACKYGSNKFKSICEFYIKALISIKDQI